MAAPSVENANYGNANGNNGYTNDNAGYTNGHANGNGNLNTSPDHYDRNSMLGSLHSPYDEEPAPPLLYFHSPVQAWVRTFSQPATCMFGTSVP